MKIALCLHGLASGKNDRGVPVSIENSMSSIKGNLMSDYDVDVFYHTWSKDSEEYLNESYSPKGYEIEEQINFDHPFKPDGEKSADFSFTPEVQVKMQSTYSRWYSLAKSIKLKKDYEKENDMKYDFVFSTRFDIAFYEKFINFESLDPNNFYVSNWWQNRYKFGYNDPWFFSGSDNMDTIAGLYGKMDEYLSSGSEYERYMMSLNEIGPMEPPSHDKRLSNHGLLRHHVKSNGITSMFLGLEYNTWSLVRKIPSGRNNPHYKNGFPLPLNEPIEESRGSKNLTGPVGAGW
tara:strand:- start:34423 stop:35295 length:873 start_codon:yes stop_codon:yes gene_type:complete